MAMHVPLLSFLPSTTTNTTNTTTTTNTTKATMAMAEETRALASLAHALDGSVSADDAGTRHVHVDAWIRVTQAVVRVFRRFGVAFAPAQSDLQRNVDKIRAFRAHHLHVEDMLLHEKQMSTSQQDPSGTVAVLWTRRAFHFLWLALEAYVSKHVARVQDVCLRRALSESYARTLQPYHGVVLYLVFQSSLALAPRTEAFFKRLGYDVDEDQDVLVHDVEACVRGLRDLVEHVADFYVRHDLEDPRAV